MSKADTEIDLDNDPFWNGTATRGEMKIQGDKISESETERMLEDAIAELTSWGDSVELSPLNKPGSYPLRLKQKELLSAVSIGHNTVVKLLAAGFGGPHGQLQSKRNNVNKALVCLCKLGYLQRESVIRTTERNTNVSEYQYSLPTQGE